MLQKNLHCSEQECQQKSEQSIFLIFTDLETQLQCCEQCYNGLFKTNEIASKTYHLLSVMWAERHNQIVGVST